MAQVNGILVQKPHLLGDNPPSLFGIDLNIYMLGKAAFGIGVTCTVIAFTVTTSPVTPLVVAVASFAAAFFLLRNYEYRLLLLDGDEGSVACRVHGKLLAGTLPRISENGHVELASRSWARMKNLKAIRGLPQASMVGPCDYFGNLEAPHKDLFAIQMTFPPTFVRTELPKDYVENRALKPFDKATLTVVKANWVSGDSEELKEKAAAYQVKTGKLQSLFLHPGLLELDRDMIELKEFDAKGVDLSSFKARLVDNVVPFRVTDQVLGAKDDYRMVTYLYEPGYAEWQIQQGSGLFLEKHRFSQSITPLTPNSKGFVALARKNQDDELEIVGIKIPYGHTLIIEEGCIHGDTTLSGFFMMGMTSDHTTMGTADTVFLKSARSKKNVSMTLPDAGPQFSKEELPAPVHAIYKGASNEDRARFRKQTAGQNFIFNPLSWEYFHK